MNRQQFLVSLRKASTQRRNRRANQKIWDNLVDLSEKEYAGNRYFNALLKDLQRSPLPFI